MRRRRAGCPRWRRFVCVLPSSRGMCLAHGNEQMADAGWHYAPSKESNDFAICAYCELSLDGWEATDNPMEEHQRRSPSCIFFNWKSVKRPTKKPRASLQSAAPTVLSIHDPDSPPKKASRKKAKKPDHPLDPLPVDPELSRGRKRPSTVPQGPVIIYDGSKSTSSESESQPPPPKKRATRASLAHGPSADHKMTDNSDVDPTISNPLPKKKPGRRPSKARAPSKTRGRKPKVDAQSDDDLDRALAADLERPLTDEEEGFKDFKKPFIRPAKRLTRSRASIAVEESAKDAPEGVLVHTSASARRGRSRTPAAEERGKTPMKGFFREISQDFSVPVRVPKHLMQEEEVLLKSPERQRQEEVAEGIVRGFSTEREKVKKKGRKKASEATTVLGDEEESKPKARKKAEAAVAADDAPKPKRGRPPKKVVARSRSNTLDSQARMAAEAKQEVTTQQEQLAEAVPEKPKRGRKPKQAKGATARSSAVSIASTAISAPEEPEPHQPPMDIDPAPEDASDAGSVIRYDVTSAPYPVLPVTSDVEPEKEQTPQKPAPVKRGKKTSAGAVKKKSTRSSVLSQATITSMSTDATGSIINSGDESDVSRASRTGVKKGRKIVRKTSKTVPQNRNIEDVLKKGSESFFNSSQSEELERGRGKKVEVASVRGSVRSSFNNDKSSVRGSFAEKMSLGSNSVRGSFVSETNDDVRMVEAAVQEEEVRAPGSRVVSWADNGYPRLPAAPEEELSVTDVDAEEEQVQSPVNVAPSFARRPLSPVRTAVNLPLATTPKSHGKGAGRVPSTRPWTAVDLEAVLANLSTGDGEEEAGGLSKREMEMTVEEWVKFSAAQAEFRMTGEAERIIEIFEREGRRAVEAVEGIVTVD